MHMGVHSLLLFHTQKKALASALFDSVCRRLDILEREYFGIEYEDDKKLMVCSN